MLNKYRLMFSYMKTIKANIKNIESFFLENQSNFAYKITSLEIDNAYRIYTVLNFPPKTTENIQKYGHVYMDNEIKKFIKDLNIELNQIGLFELIALTRVDQKGESSVLINVEYKFVNIPRLFRNLIIGGISIISLLFYLFI